MAAAGEFQIRVARVGKRVNQSCVCAALELPYRKVAQRHRGRAIIIGHEPRFQGTVSGCGPVVGAGTSGADWLAHRVPRTGAGRGSGLVPGERVARGETRCRRGRTDLLGGIARESSRPRIVGESGEDYLYHKGHFVFVDFPPTVKNMKKKILALESAAS